MSERITAIPARLRTGVAFMVMIALAFTTAAVSSAPARAAGPYTVGGAVTFASGYSGSDIPNAYTAVWIQSTTSSAGYTGTFSQDTGRWTATGVPEGTYRIRIDPSWMSRLGMEYYNNAPVSDQATVVTVTGDRNDINFHLEPKIDDPTTWPRIFRGASEAFFLAVGDTLRIEPPVFPFATTAGGYRWYSDGVLIPGAVGQEYTVTVAELGKKISVGYIAVRAGYTSREFREDNSFTVSKGSFVPKNITVTGEARVGNTLAASTSGWTPTPTSFSWRWQRGGVDIAGATSASYTLTAADLGTTVAVIATAKLEGYYDTERSSSTPVSAGRFATAPTVTLPATVRVGVPVTPTEDGSWTATPDSVLYQWLNEGEPIAGATSLTYTPRPEDFNKRLVLRVTAKKAAYEDRVVTTSAKWPVAGVL